MKWSRADVVVKVSAGTGVAVGAVAAAAIAGVADARSSS
jgi:hypothetical protein